MFDTDLPGELGGSKEDERDEEEEEHGSSSEVRPQAGPEEKEGDNEPCYQLHE